MHANAGALAAVVLVMLAVGAGVQRVLLCGSSSSNRRTWWVVV
jgi:hypothetical protein